jgi:hypothetical protein
VALAGVGLLVALLTSFFGDGGLKRFGFAYVTSYAYFLSIAIGALLFLALQHVTRAGWSVTVRRLTEIVCGTFPLLAVLFIPILLFVIMDDKFHVYPWAATHADAAAAHGGADDGRMDVKQSYLSISFFVVRWVFYFAIWIGLAQVFRSNSLKQDDNGDPNLTRRMEAVSAPGLALLALTLSFASFDLLMSLEPRWFSTIFGVYFFIGSMAGFMATLILVSAWLGRRGLLGEHINVEHRHDLGKWLFTFVFFWGYIAFCQYMLIWYGNLPEETMWFETRGATTAVGQAVPWWKISIALLVLHFIVPFVGLLSRHVKRSQRMLQFWAVWMLVMHWVDMWWLVMPQYDKTILTLGLPELGCLLGLGGACAAAMAKAAGDRPLIPTRDPRLGEAHAFVNI